MSNGPSHLPNAVYPGTFDPPTIAHIHLALTAIEQLGIGHVDFAISARTLGKDDARLTPIADRVDELTLIAAADPRLGVITTVDSLLADISEGYDVVILGADKWHQVIDPVWYGDVDARDEALQRLPLVAIAPRPPWTLPGEDASADPPDGVSVVVLETDPSHHEVSATEVRAGRHEWRATRDLQNP